MSRRRITFALCTVVLLIVLTACAQRGTATPSPTDRHPFSLTMAGEGGTEVSVDGYRDGYRPGATETLQLAVRNGAEAAWQGNVCIQLLEPVPSDVVMPLAEEGISLEPGSGYAREVTVQLPADLSPGTFGLAVVVNRPAGPSVSVTTITVGEGQEAPFHGDWPTEAALAACPAP